MDFESEHELTPDFFPHTDEFLLLDFRSRQHLKNIENQLILLPKWFPTFTSIMQLCSRVGSSSRLNQLVLTKIVYFCIKIGMKLV